MRQTRNSIFTSTIALLLVIAMFAGTTFAWFTDSATSLGNVIQSGNLDAKLHWSNELLASDSTEWIDASNGAVFTHNDWEPGYTEVKYIKVTNAGTLNFKWKLTVEADGPVTSLSDVIDVYYVNPITNELTSLEGHTSVGTLTEVMMNKTNSTGRLTAGQDVVLAIAFHMDEQAGNEYQDMSLCDNGFSLKLLATQDVGESDSFGDDYDLDADWEEGSVNFTASASLTQVPLIYGTLASDITIGSTNGISAYLPTGVKVADGASSLDLSINRVDDDNITLDYGTTASSLDVHIEGIAADNTVPMIVNLGAVLQSGLDVTELKLYHIENGSPVLMTRVNTSADFAIHNQYTYNSETGEVSIYVATFSVFSAVQTTADVWDGASDTSWYNENDTEFTLATVEQFVGFRDLVDGGNTFEGKTVILGTDIDLDKIPFDPIGFDYENKGGKVFKGTFDGGNHTIYNLYQNGWELDQDKTNYSTYTYSTAGAGLFASIKNATIKNLAISGAEVVFECVDMGIVVGYAQGECHFENIVVTDSKIANYNRYTGGLVGEVSGGVDNDGDGFSHTFKNITIDSTVTVSGLWGSFGCGMGGVIGGKWGDATVKMENVISAPVMDVYNDVVSAYQWYAFRGCGMLIGHTEEPCSDGRTAGNATASFLTCENVKVYYGDWVNYTYYQFANQTDAEGNTLWYSNYPWVRAEEGVYCDAFSNIRYGIPLINGVKVTELSDEKFNAAVTSTTKIIFDQLYGADRGMYGTATHDGVEVIYGLGETKTIYIYNDQNWENLKLYYWYRNGEDTWSNVSEDGVSMDNMELSNFENVYRLRLPAYVDGFMITDGTNESEFTLADLENDGIYTLGGEAHEHSYTDGKCECGAYKNQKCELVTDVTSLNYGDKIIIAAVNSNVALSTTQNSNNRTPVQIVKNADDTITLNANVQIITLEAGNKEGTFAFNVGNGYLYAAGSSNNTLKTETNLSDNSSWLITVDQGGVATVKAQGTNSHNWLRYNSTSSLFSCYEFGQQDIAIYKISASDEIIEAHNCYDFAVGATCEDNAVCSKCSIEIVDSALGHDYVGKETAPTCTDAGYITYNCSRCEDSYRADGSAALGHQYVDAVCSACGAIDSTAIDFSGRYYIATIRTSGNYFYMTNNLGDASTKRYQAVDSELTILPEEITNSERNKIFVLEKNDDGTYSIYAEGVDGNNYLGWTSDNSGILVAKEDALKLTVDKKEDGTYNIHFTGDAERYLALNQNSGINYFAWYKSGQKQALTLIPVKPCEHNYESVVTAPTCTADGFTTHTCTECGNSYTDSAVAATGHNHNSEVTEAATCTTAGVKTYTCTACDDSYTEEIAALGHTTDNGVCDNCGNTIGGTTPDPDPETPAETTVSMNIFANQGSLGNKEITWTSGDVTVSNAQGSSTSSILTTDTNLFRVYAKSTFSVSANDITKVVITCTSSSYATDCKNSFTKAGYTAEVNDLVVTITLASPADSITATASAQFRINKVEVTYTPETPCEHTNTTTNTVAATCTEAGSTTVTCNDCGSTISTEEIEATGHNYVDGTCTGCGAEDPNAGGTTEPTTVTMNIYANKGTTGTNTISWTSGDITVTNNKASSSTAIRTSDSDHFRVYAKSEMVISVSKGEITKVVITCTSSSYATVMQTSAKNAGYTATVSGSVVTITVDNAESITFTASAQTRLNKVEVTYTK